MSREKVLKLLDTKQSKAFNAFATSFVAALHEEEFKDHTPESLAGMVNEAWELGKKREKDGTIVKAHVVSGTKKGWLNEKTRIFMVTPDRAFIIDSVTAAIHKRNLAIRTLLHPVLTVTRDAKGMMTDATTRTLAGDSNESWMIMEVRGAMGSTESRNLEAEITSVMQDVVRATRDWKDMRESLQGSIKGLEDHRGAKTLKKSDAENLEEYIAFLQYLHDNNFTLLGSREYEFTKQGKNIGTKTVKGTSLGLFSNEEFPIYKSTTEAALPQDLQALRQNAPLVSVYKVNRRATVHRAVPMDLVAVKTFDKSGNVNGERIFIGLFTSVTYSRSVYDVPLLRHKVRQVIADIKFAPDSHDFRALAHILEKYPRDELFQMPVEQIRAHMVGILRIQDRPRVALYPRVDPFRRYVSCLVYVPRERYGTMLRTNFQNILEEELQGVCENFYTTLDDSPLARVIYSISIDQDSARDYDFTAIERKLQQASRTWTELLREAIMETHTDEHKGISLTIEYDDAFPVSYQEHFTPQQACIDISKIEQVNGTKRIALHVYRDEENTTNELRLKLFNLGSPAILTDVLPMLENTGFIVDAEYPFEVLPQTSGESVWVQDFHLRTKSGEAPENWDIIKADIEDTLAAVWYGEAENDLLNSLVVSTPLVWREISALRAYAKYMQQAGMPFSNTYIMQALVRYPVLSSALIGLFHAMHDPALPDAKRKVDKWKKAINEGLESVEKLDEDRIIRFMKSLIKATLRTNYYQLNEDGSQKDRMSFKIDSALVLELPDPRPWREIFVYSPRMEGIHLRGGKIARGGIRWSDRLEDFRTEVLALMQAQLVKNAIIVPEGAKGGFIVKRPPTERTAWLAEGVECYKTLVRGMLDITDNRVNGKIVHPANVVRHDEDDPYLVVAADKGTASYSNIANAISAEYNFWLGDAFASGGSQGYDHKGMGITARGAWECIKRHFREMGTDIQTQSQDVIGVGDMAGDVFGNGMLLSKKIHLIAAFNHMHIFLDPTPDAASSYKERERLFKAVKGWGDYDTSKLSKGGRIFLRSEKSLSLSKEIREKFGIKSETITPNDLIQILLKHKSDLLYFGGIGTFIKASNQSNAEAGDRSNDAVRVNAIDIRARVVGEGANLGVTRAARVEMGLNGVRLNADFVDNSGGVNCSDVEVNIKILLASLTEGKKPVLTLEARNKLLAEMTDEVAALVLRNSYQQSGAISLAELDGASALRTQNRFIELMEREDGVKRNVDGLPSNAQFEEYELARKGLPRPILATLVSLAKLRIYRALMASNLPDDPLAEIFLMDYFPTPLRKKYQDAIRAHGLRREIIAKQMTASIVNRLGPTFVMTVQEKTGASVAEIARACFLAREAFGLRPLWHSLEALDGKVDAGVQLKSMKQIAGLIEYLTLWFLRQGREMLETGSLDKTSKSLSACIEALSKSFGTTLPKTRAARIAANIDDALKSGLPQDIATHLGQMSPLRSALDIIRISKGDIKAIPSTATIFYQIGDELGFDWLRRQARMLPAAGFWQNEAVDGVIGQLYATQSALTQSIVQDARGKEPKAKLDAWRTLNAQRLEAYKALIADMQQGRQMDLAMLTLAEQRLRGLGA